MTGDRGNAHGDTDPRNDFVLHVWDFDGTKCRKHVCHHHDSSCSVQIVVPIFIREDLGHGSVGVARVVNVLC